MTEAMWRFSFIENQTHMRDRLRVLNPASKSLAAGNNKKNKRELILVHFAKYLGRIFIS